MEGREVGKKAIFICQILLLLILTWDGFAAADIIYSQTFTNQATYCPGSSQYDNWASFRQQLNANVHHFMRVTISGSNDPIGVSCSDLTIVSQIATALRNGTGGSWSCNGRTWGVVYACYQGSCGTVDNAMELNATGTICNCDNPGYIVRPGITNQNWGGVNTATCGAPTQTMTVTFAEETKNVPIFTEWGMIIFMVFAGGGSIYYLKRQSIIQG